MYIIPKAYNDPRVIGATRCTLERNTTIIRGYKFTAAMADEAGYFVWTEDPLDVMEVHRCMPADRTTLDIARFLLHRGGTFRTFMSDAVPLQAAGIVRSRTPWTCKLYSVYLRPIQSNHVFLQVHPKKTSSAYYVCGYHVRTSLCMMHPI